MSASQAVVAQPEWLAHRYDAATGEVHFRHVPRHRHREMPFLTDEYLGEAGRVVAIPMSEAMKRAPGGRLNFIFHSAFCASTVLVRALDAPGIGMGMSEPLILNDIAGIRRRGARPADVAQMLDGAMRLLARPFGAAESVVVKPSNILNPLAAGMLAIRPQSNAVLLYAPLPVFLASVARKGMWCRLWARELLDGLLIDGVVNLGMTSRDHFRQTDMQVAAVGWLAQHALFAAVAAKFGPERVRTLDSETLLARPMEVLSDLAGHFGLAADPDRIAQMANGPAFSRHSKSGGAFSAHARSQQHSIAAEEHRDEIEKVTIWAEAVAAGAGIPTALPYPLIG